MPLYEMKCLGCGEETQHIVKLNDDNPPCPKCLGEMEKLISAPRLLKMSVETGAIYDMRQVKDSHGERWRETKGSDKPGGAGQKMYFH